MLSNIIIYPKERGGSNLSGKSTKKILVDERYVRPQMADIKMKKAQNAKQTVYIYGTTGIGKTSFVADFLRRKRYHYFSVSDTEVNKIVEMTSKILDGLDDKSNKSTIIVIDDLSFLEEQDDRVNCEKLIEELSERRDIWLVLISRALLPKWLKSVFIRFIFITIGEKELCLSKKEQEAYFEKWEVYPTEAVWKKISNEGYGHPLILRILAMKFSSIPDTETDKNREAAELNAIEAARLDLWDYLEVHVYEQWDVELQEFLASISIVDRFDLQMAKQITKKKDAGRLIEKAQELGSFLTEFREEDREIYELKDIVKFSMRRRLFMKYSQDYIKELYHSAGSYYEMEGNVKEALNMYEKCGSEEGISRILIENMRRNPATGEYFELKHYYLALSEEKIKSSIELMSGMSLMQSILLNEEESERWYSELLSYAKKSRGSEKRAAEIRLLYLDIALPHRGSVKTKDLLMKAWLLFSERKTLLPEFSVTSNLPSLMNGGKDFCEWSRKDKELAKTIGKILTAVLGKYGKGLVNIALSESYFEKGAEDYEVASLAGNGRMQAESGGKTEQVFVAVGILIRLSIINNHMKDAESLLASFRQIAERDAPKLVPNIIAMEIRLDLYNGRISKAFQWLEDAPDEDKEFNCLERYCYLTKVRVYLAAGEKGKALFLLKKLKFYAEKAHRNYIMIEVLMLASIVMYRLGMEGWQDTLQEAVSKAEDYHFVRILTKEGTALWDLLKMGTVKWKNQKFKKQVLEECERIADYYPAYMNEKQEGNVILTDKARIILKLQAEGLSVEEIAQQLGLSKAGVKYYNQETYKKLGVNNKSAAVTEARNRGLI